MKKKRGKKLLSLLLSGAMLFSMGMPMTASAAAGDKTTLDMEKKTYTDASIASSPLQYRLFVPDNYSPNQEYPLFIYLNGAGARGSDNEKQLANLAPLLNPLMTAEGKSKYPCIIAIPQCRENKQWADTPSGSGSYNQDNVPESEHLRLVMGMIEDLKQTYSIDSSRLYLLGQSQGGYGTWDAITRYPDTFAAAVPMCGAGDPKKAEKIKDMPLLVMAGSADPSVPVKGSRDMVDALKAVGSDVTYIEFPGGDHYVQRRVFEQPDRLYAWLFAQSKDGPRNAVNTPFPTYTTAFWDDFSTSASMNSWTASGTARVSGATLAFGSAEDTSLLYTGDGSFGDGVVSAYIKQTSTTGGGGLVLRMQDAKNLINIRFTSGTNVEVLEYSNGSAAQSPKFPFVWNTSTLYLMKAVIKGDTLNVYIDNIPVVKDYKIKTAALKSTGKVGLRTYKCPLSVDDFRAFTQDEVNISTPVMNETVSTLPVTVNGMSTHTGKTMKVLVDGTEAASTTVGSDGAFSVELTGLTNGEHTVKAQVMDDGTVLASDEIKVTSALQSFLISDLTFKDNQASVNLYNTSGAAKTAVLKVEAFDENGGSLHSVQDEINLSATSEKQNFSLAFDISKLSGAATVKASLLDTAGQPLSGDKVISLLEAQIGLDDFDDYQVLQRDVDKENRVVSVTGDYEGGNVSGIQVSVVKYDSGETVADWQNAALQNGKFTADITVPQGGWYRLKARALNIAGVPTEPVQGIHKWGVGMVILCIGQSNMVGIGLDKPYVEANDLVANYRNDAWEHLSDPYDKGDSSVAGDGSIGGSMVPTLGNKLVEQYGIPVAFIPCAKGGTSLLGIHNDWSKRNESNPADRSNLYGNSIYRARAVGGIELIVMNQGEHDVSDKTPGEDYEKAFRKLFDNYQKDLGYHVPLFYGQLGASGHSAFVGKDDVMTGIRTAQYNCDNGEDFLMATTEFDLAKNPDDLHYTTKSQSILGERMANAIRYYYGDSTYYRGPELQSAAFTDDTKKELVVSVRHFGGSDLTVPAKATGFTVVDGDKVITPSAVEKVDSLTLRITLPEAVSKDAKLRYLYGSNPDTSGIIHDNTALALPLTATTAPLSITSVDKAELSALYQQHKDKEQGNYTDQSFADFKAALNGAKAVLDKPDATQQEVADALAALQEAVKNLTEKPKVDKTELEALYDQHKDKEQGNYTDLSFDTFQAALETARKLLLNEAATQQQLDDAKAALQKAIDNLKEKPVDSEKPEDPKPQPPEKPNGSGEEPGGATGTGDNGLLGLTILSAAALCAVVVVRRRKNAR